MHIICNLFDSSQLSIALSKAGTPLNEYLLNHSNLFVIPSSRHQSPSSWGGCLRTLSKSLREHTRIEHIKEQLIFDEVIIIKTLIWEGHLLDFTDFFKWNNLCISPQTFVN